MLLGITGDMHNKNNNPRHRLDIYQDALYAKLNHVLYSGIHKHFNLGDVFDKPTSTEPIKNALIMDLQTAKMQGIDSYAVIGNHDIYYNNTETFALKKTALYNVCLSGAFILLDHEKPLDFDGVPVYTMPYHFKDVPDFLKKVSNDCKSISHAIILGHHYYEFEFAQHASLTKQILDFAFCDNEKTTFSIFLGHDHEQYQPVVGKNYTVYRPGSLGRIALTAYNLIQKPAFYTYDTKTHEVKMHYIPCKDASEIFNINNYKQRKTHKKVFSDIQARLQSCSMTNDVCTKSMSEELQEINTPNDAYEYVKTLYAINNLDF